jgi:hypothetical protein
MDSSKPSFGANPRFRFGIAILRRRELSTEAVRSMAIRKGQMLGMKMVNRTDQGAIARRLWRVEAT